MEYSYDDIKNFKSKKVHICIYSNIFSLTKVMTDLDLKKDFIIDWLNNVVDNTFYLEETEKNEIINLLNNEENLKKKQKKILFKCFLIYFVA